MSGSNDSSQIIPCRCGQVEVRTKGTPIITSCCFCDSCRTAGRTLEHLPGASAVLRPDGGTDFVLKRKNGVECLRGSELLAEYRLTPASATRRVVATCCNSYMFLDFTPGHWVSVVRNLLPPSTRPPVEVYMMLGDLPEGVVPADGVPRAKRLPLRFMRKLLFSWAAMGFRRPRIEFVTKNLDP
jgi:hypothetical protein